MSRAAPETRPVSLPVPLHAPDPLSWKLVGESVAGVVAKPGVFVRNECVSPPVSDFHVVNVRELGEP